MKKRLALCALGLLLCGCGKPDLVVVDPDGNPIAGAQVIGISLSTSGPVGTTDEQGRADIPKAAPKTEWIGVRKPGYIPVDNLAVTDVTLPLKIILQPLDE